MKKRELLEELTQTLLKRSHIFCSIVRTRRRKVSDEVTSCVSVFKASVNDLHVYRRCGNV